jgi:hypothetical protein
MRPSKFVLGLAVLTLAGVLPTVSADSKDQARPPAKKFTAHLVGTNEVPPTASLGEGMLKLTLSDDETSLEFDLTYSGLTGPPAAAHIHFGPTKVNGGVMVFFCGGGGKPPCPTENAGEVTGTIVAADVVGPTAQLVPPGNLTPVILALRNKLAYANMHTAAAPGGEIRGPVMKMMGKP